MTSSVSKNEYDNERQFLRDLLVACEKDELDKVKTFEKDLKAKNGISVCDYKDGRKSGCVHAAARGGANSTLEFLLSLRPEQGGMKDAEGRTPLMAACSSEHGAACVKYLLESSAPARETVDDESNGVRAIHLAASLDSDESLNLLLNLGKADPNSPSNAGLPLHWAAGHANNPNTCKALMATGAVDVNARDPQGCTAVIVAALRAKSDMVQFLCDAGADLSLFAHNLGALGAAAAGGSKECVEIILRKGGDGLCLMRDPVENLLPIDVAAHSGHEDIVEFLGPRSGMKGLNAAQLIKEAKEEHEKRVREAAEEQRAANEAANKIKELGNQLFLQQKFQEAVDKYLAAYDSSSKISDYVKATLLSNASACYLKMNQLEQAREMALKAKDADPKFIKANFRLGQAYSALKNHHDAAQAYWDAYNLDKAATDAANYLNLFKKEIDAGKQAYSLQQQQQQKQ